MAPASQSTLRQTQQKVNFFMPADQKATAAPPVSSQKQQQQSQPVPKPKQAHSAPDAVRDLAFHGVTIVYPAHVTVTTQRGELRLKFGQQDADEIVIKAGTCLTRCLMQSIKIDQTTASHEALTKQDVIRMRIRIRICICIVF